MRKRVSQHKQEFDKTRRHVRKLQQEYAKSILKSSEDIEMGELNSDKNER